MFVSFLGSSVISSRSDLLQLLLRVRCASANRERRGVLGHDRKGRSTSASHLLVDARGQGCSETYTRGLGSRDYLQARYSSWRAGRLSRGSWSFPRTWATRAVLRARRIMADPGWQARRPEVAQWQCKDFPGALRRCGTCPCVHEHGHVHVPMYMGMDTGHVQYSPTNKRILKTTP